MITAGFQAVSYTHLDVYKRQIIIIFDNSLIKKYNSVRNGFKNLILSKWRDFYE